MSDEQLTLEELIAELVGAGYRIVQIDEGTRSVLADIGGTRRRIFLDEDNRRRATAMTVAKAWRLEGRDP
jgi:hypothetical protein